jgi:predicted transcriptional regulator
MIGRVKEKIDMLDRHLDVMHLVITHEPIGIVRTSNKLNQPHHKVRYSFRVLEEGGLIDSSPQGAITTEQTSESVDNIDTRIEDIRETLDGLIPDDEAETEDEERAQQIMTAQN